MVQYYKRFVEIIARRNFDFSEFQGAVIAVVWGIWMLMIGDDIFPTGLIRSNMIGIWFLLLGTAQCTGLLANALTLRRTCTVVAAASWLFLALVESNQN